MSRQDAQDARIERIIGDDDDLTFEDCIDRFYDHLKSNLQLPCIVTGIEDFRWEEFYVIGPGDPTEYERLRKDRPSYQDKYDLLAIEKDASSEWMMFLDEDIGGYVRRHSDDKEFFLGLAEIKPVDKKSKNYQLLRDYAVWFVNNR
ncbi:MAG: hypothetical protein WD738_01775 [Pirellulales bacterium]